MDTTVFINKVKNIIIDYYIKDCTIIEYDITIIDKINLDTNLYDIGDYNLIEYIKDKIETIFGVSLYIININKGITFKHIYDFIVDYTNECNVK